MVLGMIIYHETVTWFMASGAVITIIGIVFVNLEGLRQTFQKPLKARDLQN